MILVEILLFIGCILGLIIILTLRRQGKELEKELKKLQEKHK